MADEEKATKAVLTEPPKTGKSVVATLVGEKFVVGDREITSEGVEVPAAEAKSLFEAAKQNDVTLVVLKEESE